jgi:hypothetical protein
MIGEFQLIVLGTHSGADPIILQTLLRTLSVETYDTFASDFPEDELPFVRRREEEVGCGYERVIRRWVVEKVVMREKNEGAGEDGWVGTIMNGVLGMVSPSPLSPHQPDPPIFTRPSIFTRTVQRKPFPENALNATNPPKHVIPSFPTLGNSDLPGFYYEDLDRPERHDPDPVELFQDVYPRVGDLGEIGTSLGGFGFWGPTPWWERAGRAGGDGEDGDLGELGRYCGQERDAWGSNYRGDERVDPGA